jgi:hypothetical protein
MDSRDVVVISDMHVGSPFALMPDKFESLNKKTGDYQSYPLNKTQKLLYAHWSDMCKSIKKHPPEAIILNGDLIDGTSRKNEGRYESITEPLRQIEACIQLLDMLPPKVPKFFTQGSNYHVDNITPAEEYIADKMDGEFGPDLLVCEAGIRIHASHYISVSKSSWQYWSTPIAKDSLLLAVNDSEKKYGHVDVALRSHAHYFAAVEFTSTMGIISPCWQVRNEYAALRDIVSPPEIGYLTIRNFGEIEGTDRKNILLDRSGFIKVQMPVVRKVGREA